MKEFARSPDAGHYDAIDSLIYLVRNVQKTKNPYPPGYGFVSREEYFQPQATKDYTPQQQQWLAIFKPRTSLKINK
jgi:hypothetical protein